MSLRASIDEEIFSDLVRLGQLEKSADEEIIENFLERQVQASGESYGTFLKQYLRKDGCDVRELDGRVMIVELGLDFMSALTVLGPTSSLIPTQNMCGKVLGES